MRIYFVRHGETEYNKKKIVQGSGVDSSLNETGQNQAQSFFEKYKEVDFELVYTSNLQRTQQTAAGFIDLGIPHIATADINEINWGVHEGKSSTPFMINAYKELIEKWGSNDFDARLEEGESANELQTRLNRFLNQLKNRTEKNIAVFTHGRTLRCMMCLIEGKHLREMESYSHNNTGLFLVRYEYEKYEVVLNNDTSHLT